MNLILKVLNSTKEMGEIEEKIFPQRGGVIGTGTHCDWILNDKDHSISDIHLEISYYNKQYFLMDVSSQGTQLKSTLEFLPKNELIVLKRDDSFIVGNYEIKVDIIEVSNNEPDIWNMLNQREIDEVTILSSERSSPVNVILDETPTERDILSYVDIIPEEEDPFMDLETRNLLDETLSEHMVPPEFKEENKSKKIEKNVNDSGDATLLAIFSQKLGLDLLQLDHIDQTKVISELADLFSVMFEGVEQLSNNQQLVVKKINRDKDTKIIKRGDLSQLLEGVYAGERISKNLSLIIKEILVHHTALYQVLIQIDKEIVEKFSPKKIYTEALEKSKHGISLHSKEKIAWKFYEKKFDDLNNIKKRKGIFMHKMIHREYQKAIAVCSLVEGKL